MTYFVGIDPGINGALAWITESNNIYVFDMPVKINEKDKKEIDVRRLHYLLNDHEAVNAQIFIENVHALPNQSTVSGFTFGLTCGRIKAAVELVTKDENIIMVTPQKWKKYFKVTSDKIQTWEKAVELFPAYYNDLVTKRGKKLIDRAEDLLIAEYGRQTYKEV